MNKEIGRNDQCLCMSGKKYKNCCLENKEIVDYFKNILNARYIDGSYMLKNLTENSNLLERYLSEKLPMLKQPIVWLFDSNLNSNMRCGQVGDAHIIIVKEIPVQYKDYFDVAHEIGHLLFGEQGYPAVNVRDNDFSKTYLASVLINTVMDPKVNKEIIKYGFDFKDYINKAISIQIPMINRYPNENNLHKFDEHFLKCLLIEKLLEWDLLEENNENTFERLYKEKYPIIYKEVLESIKFMREFGTDTPEKVRIILQKIIDDNEMNNYLEIV